MNMLVLFLAIFGLVLMAGCCCVCGGDDTDWGYDDDYYDYYSTYSPPIE